MKDIFRKYDLVSVVVPLYNKEHSIALTIESILNQTYENFEVILIDDGSTDNSADVVKQYNDKRIKYYYKCNEGVSVARNYGIAIAASEYIALLDGDDIWRPAFLQEMLEFIGDTPNASLWGCGYEIQDENCDLKNWPIITMKEGYRDYVDNYFKVACKNTLFTSSSVIFRKSIFNKIGRYDENLIKGEDMDLWFRFALNGRVAYYNKPLAIYRWQAENRVMQRIVDKNKCLIWTLEKYKKYEETNYDFKYMLDNWRLAHIVNYLLNRSTEVFEITPLLKQMDLKNFGKRWTIIRYTPHFLQRFVYRLMFNKIC